MRQHLAYLLFEMTRQDLQKLPASSETGNNLVICEYHASLL
jgi:hypothetical protein